MLGSNFFEDLVVKEGGEGKATSVAIIGGIGVALIVVLACMTSTLLLLVAVAAGFAVWYFSRNCKVEYEYVVAEDDFEVTKIIAQSKRKPMVSTQISKITAFGKLYDAQSEAAGTLVLACTAQDDSAYYAEFADDTYGEVRLVFTPNPRFLLYFSKHLPRTLHFQYTPPAELLGEQFAEDA